ncbi:PLP-dependent aminotransferase family protein [candidate division KSB1 bacterium]|nr:PLP-dependent aminotransferase family protein [candidate division KSB1 bacterium]
MKDKFALRIRKTQKSFIREILKSAADPSVISFAGGLPNPDFFPVQEIKQACTTILETDGPGVLQYSTTEGYPPLREYIAKRYLSNFGMHIEPEDILITNGSQQGIDLCAKVFVNENDAVLIEEPGYLGAIQALSLYSPRFLTIPLNKDGIDPSCLADICTRERIKLFYAVPTFQNPSGTAYSLEIRRQTAQVLQQYDTIFVEDDPYGEITFRTEPVTPVKKYLGDRSILLGSFSKIVVPSFRLGWICASREFMDKLIIAKQGADLHTNYFSQRIVFELLSNHNIDDHIAKIRNAYKTQRDAMIKSIQNYFPLEIDYTQPDGGMFLWVTLPDGLSSLKLFDQAIRQKVAFVPGTPFFVNGGGENTLRLNFSNSDVDTIDRGMKILGELIKKMLT